MFFISEFWPQGGGGGDNWTTEFCLMRQVHSPLCCLLGLKSHLLSLLLSYFFFLIQILSYILLLLSVHKFQLLINLMLVEDGPSIICMYALPPHFGLWKVKSWRHKFPASISLIGCNYHPFIKPTWALKVVSGRYLDMVLI